MAYKFYYSLCRLISLLPLNVLYVFADACYPIVHYIARYRVRVVRQQLRESFPEKSTKELRKIEARFYHLFCDYFVENLKLFSMSKEEMMRRMTFSGLEHVRASFANGAKFNFTYLGHVGNWEWIASLQYWLPEVHCTQIYHKVYNKIVNQMLLDLREQYGGECIKMRHTFRRLLQLRSSDKPVIVGFISDQQPKWKAIHHFSRFLNHDTGVFIGTEHIAKKLDAAITYARVTRPRRGYYHCEFVPVTDNANEYPDYELTDLYMQMLERDIRLAPHLWLWSHKRWSRTKEEWEERKKRAIDF